MRKTTKKALCILSAAVMAFNGWNVNGTLKTTNTLEAATASTSTTITSGNCSTDTSLVIGNTTLYFGVFHEMYNRAAVTGCITTQANTALTIPSKVTINGKEYKVEAIDKSAFKNQTNITSVTTGLDMQTIGNSAFEGCTKLKSFTVPQDSFWSTIGEKAFYGCNLLTSFNKTETYTVGDYAFYGCKSLNKIRLTGTRTLGKCAFAECWHAQSIDISQTNITTIPEKAFHFALQTKSIKLPSTVTSIGYSAFGYCQNVDTVYLPESVTSLGNRVFECCTKLKTVLTPEAIESVGDCAFDCCDNLKYFVCKNPNASFGSYSIGYCQGVKTNGFTIWGQGGNIQDYAKKNGFTYRSTSTAANYAKQSIANYKWNIANSASIFADSKTNKYSMISAHTPYDEADLHNTTWKTSELGLACVTALVKNGVINMSDLYMKSVSNIASITASNITNETKSYVNVCQSVAKDMTQINDYSTTFLFDSKEMTKYMEYITYGADAAVISYSSHDCVQKPYTDNAFVCYGVEFKENVSDKTNAEWNYKGINANMRLLLYNPADTSEKVYTIYINTETGSWYSPFSKSYGLHENGYTTYIDCKFYLSHSAEKIAHYIGNDEQISGEDLLCEF